MPKTVKNAKVRGKTADHGSVARSSVAVVETGGKQYVVKPGQEIVVEKLDAKEGAKVELRDLLHGLKVAATALSHFRTPKLLVIKFKPKVRYLRRRGHRQWHTRLKIESIKE